MPRFLIAAAHKSSGKTVIATGLAAAFAARGVAIQTFKKGPDYIDPMWLSAASGRPCYNLDFNTMTAQEIGHLFAQHSRSGDLSMVEANKGLYDGVDLLGSDSNAELAKILQTPVVLVVDTSGMTRGIAPLLLGYRAFDRAVNIVGVILNKTGGTR
ncbi:MAG: AAA family ATPase, partial [Alphaproteobacteria bacterium]|nr:AAA family ATPase [Alphaproteobacteria bacterium]